MMCLKHAIVGNNTDVAVICVDVAGQDNVICQRVLLLVQFRPETRKTISLSFKNSNLCKDKENNVYLSCKELIQNK